MLRTESRKEEDGKIPGSSDMIEAYIGARAIDKFFPPSEVKAKKKSYNINDSMGI